MASEPPVAVYDACVLYPFHLRNVLIQCAFDGLVEARWTDDIHAEWMRNLAGNSPGTPLKRLEATRDLMKAVLPDADVADYRTLIPNLSCLIPTIGTFWLPPSPARLRSLSPGTSRISLPPIQPHGVAAISPDDFLVSLHSTYRNVLIGSIKRARQNLRRTQLSVEEFIGALDAQGLTAFSRILRRKAAQLV